MQRVIKLLRLQQVYIYIYIVISTSEHESNISRACFLLHVERLEQQPSNNWKGFFNVYSYTQYFDVDTDVVVNRLMSSLYPTSGDFFNKIDANPDM